MLNTVRERLIFLHQLPSMTRRMLYILLRYEASLKTVFTLTPQQLSLQLKIPMKKAVQLYREIQTPTSSAQIQNEFTPIHIMTVYDKRYPKSLKMIPDSPLVLYAIGDVSLLHDEKSISVIGTRKPSQEALSKLTYIVTPLIHEEWVIVSGLAYGIDSMAHMLTLDHSGKTIAVLGGGFHHVYPRAHLDLFHHIAANGLVISEYPPFQRPQKYHFPERNRIISGLSRATLVIEATEKSGTLITVDQALEQGKEVYAVPGSPLLSQTKGCHKIIQEGAKLVANAHDILEDWGTI